MDTKTWREVEDFQPMVVQRLRLGNWVAVHVRVQGVRAIFGSNSMGVLETIPPQASYGWPDWLCWHPSTVPGLALELKSEAGVVDRNQQQWLARLARTGWDVAVVRPRHLALLHRRLVLHEQCPRPCPGSGPLCMGWCKVRWHVT